MVPLIDDVTFGSRVAIVQKSNMQHVLVCMHKFKYSMLVKLLSGTRCIMSSIFSHTMYIDHKK